MFEKYKIRVRNAIVGGTLRDEILFIAVDVILMLLGAFMSVVNVITGEIVVLYATLTVTIIGLINILLLRQKVPKIVPHLLLYLSVQVILFFFVISGQPDGFSSLWLSIIPMLAMMMMGMKIGSIYSGVALLILIFLFWTPVGRSLLQYDYNSTFLLRYPFFYVAIYALSLATEYIRKVTHDKLMEANERYRHLYRHDALTGLYNRYGINEHMRLHDSAGMKAAVIIMDIDNFKRVNDTYGHDAGDAVLKNVADILQSSVCDDCTYARWGGEEFLVYMACEHDAVETAERIRANVEQSSVTYDDVTISVTISLGVCIEDENSMAVEKIINEADKCLYESKTTGKNRVTMKRI